MTQKKDTIELKQSRFLTFDRLSPTVWAVENRKKDCLGTIKFDFNWKKYVYETDNLKYDKECLIGILKKLIELEGVANEEK